MYVTDKKWKSVQNFEMIEENSVIKDVNDDQTMTALVIKRFLNCVGIFFAFILLCNVLNSFSFPHSQYSAFWRTNIQERQYFLVLLWKNQKLKLQKSSTSFYINSHLNFGVSFKNHILHTKRIHFFLFLFRSKVNKPIYRICRMYIISYGKPKNYVSWLIMFLLLNMGGSFAKFI